MTFYVIVLFYDMHKQADAQTHLFVVCNLYIFFLSALLPPYVHLSVYYTFYIIELKKKKTKADNLMKHFIW